MPKRSLPLRFPAFGSGRGFCGFPAPESGGINHQLPLKSSGFPLGRPVWALTVTVVAGGANRPRLLASALTLVQLRPTDSFLGRYRPKRPFPVPWRLSLERSRDRRHHGPMVNDEPPTLTLLSPPPKLPLLPKRHGALRWSRNLSRTQWKQNWVAVAWMGSLVETGRRDTETESDSRLRGRLRQ